MKPTDYQTKYFDEKFSSIHTRLDSIEALAAHGVAAKNELNSFKAQIRVVWTLIVGLPAIAGVVALLGLFHSPSASAGSEVIR